MARRPPTPLSSSSVCVLLALLVAVLLAPAPAWAQALAPDDEAVADARTGGASADDPAPAPAPARPRPVSYAASGGVSPDAAKDAGESGAISYGEPTPGRPVARVFEVAPGRAVQGDALRLRLRIDHGGVRFVRARVVVLDPQTGRVGARFSLGSVRVNRSVVRAWPRRAGLAPGAWLVRLHVKDPAGATLARASSTSGKANLVVEERPRPRPEKPQPEPQPDPNPPTTGSGTFPVAGSFSWGGAGSRFGSGRPGHRHEGQDLAAPEGTPVVSPRPGVVAFVKFQEGGAGWYVVINADDGRAFFFAHLKTGSITVKPGQRVGEATTIGQVGSTGASSGPHLHFEIWEGGWRDRGGHPIDPLAQLRAWDR
jgi:murein DD-endopeptidase MepM/ murein hydrolase activator NlpD